MRWQPSLAEYAARWLATVKPVVAPRTWRSYEWAVRLHLVPALGAVVLVELTRGQIKALLAVLLARGLARDTVRLVWAALSAMLGAAVDDELVPRNPAARMGRALRLVAAPPARQQRVRAMTRGQVEVFLAAARTAVHAGERRLWPLFLLLARSGLTVGEAFAVQWADLDARARAIHVERALSGRTVGPPKRHRARTVDMSRQLAATLRVLHAERRLEARLRRWPAVPPWVFCTTAGTPLDYARVRRAFRAACQRAGLEGFTPHSLRHSFASLLLAQGESPAYVQRQLGHCSIRLTVDTYGKWLPMTNLGAVDRLDDDRGVS